MGIRFQLTLRAKLTLWALAIFTIIFWMFGLVLWLYVARTVSNEFVNIIEGRATGLAAAIGDRMPGLSEAELQQLVEDEGFSMRIDWTWVSVLNGRGESAVLGRSVWEPEVSGEHDEGFRDAISAAAVEAASGAKPGNARFVKVPGILANASGVKPRRYGVLVPVTGRDGVPYAVYLEGDDLLARSRVARQRELLLILAAAVPPLAGLAGWFISGIAVAPFMKLQEVIDDLRVDRLDRKIEYRPKNPEVALLTQDLDDARRDINEAFEAQERFLSNVSHEIKTPIAVMRVEAQTLDLSDASDDVKYFVGSVQEEMQRLGNLVESFLTLTRLEDGHGSIRGKRYAVNDLIMDSVEQCALMGEQQNVWLRPDLFADDDMIDVSVAGDPELLTTMLGNLIRNGITHSPEDSGVRVVPTIEGDRVRIAVIDSGPGIPADRIGSVFDRFSQAGGSERKGRGHGLGLTIAKGIAELHQGTIGVTSEAGQGCEFAVVLPILRDDAPRPV